MRDKVCCEITRSMLLADLAHLRIDLAKLTKLKRALTEEERLWRGVLETRIAELERETWLDDNA